MDQDNDQKLLKINQSFFALKKFALAVALSIQNSSKPPISVEKKSQKQIPRNNSSENEILTLPKVGGSSFIQYPVLFQAIFITSNSQNLTEYGYVVLIEKWFGFEQRRSVNIDI